MQRSWRDSALGLFLPVAALLACAALPASAGAQSPQPAGGARVLARPAAPRPLASSAAREVSSARAPARPRDAAGELADPSVPPPRREPPPIGLDFALATAVPLSVGLEATLELPLGLLLRGHVGFVPEPYVGAVNGVLRDVGAYGNEIATLVDRSGSNALVLRATGGIRPVPGYGFEILAGYTYIDASSSVSVEDFEAATGQPMRYPGLNVVGITADLHMLHVELGWSAVAWDHLVIRGSIGWAHTLATSNRVEIPDVVRAQAPEMIDAIEDDVDDAITSYGFTPLVSIAVGYRF